MYHYKRQVDLSYEDAMAKLKQELQKEGFGVLTEIDVKETMKKKLNVDFGKYAILGACNPPFAHQALQAEIDIGVLMPCNVVVYEQNGKTYVATTLPTVTMGSVENQDLAPLAPQIENKLKKAIDSV
jgi:uncharacterized protein (DUF302 family)